jgi:hypothetical protein
VTVPDATACPPSVVAGTIMRTIELGVMITDAAVDEKQTTIFCSPVARDARCPDCGREGRYRDTVIRPMTDLPVAGYPLVLRVAVPRYRCTTPECGRAVFNQGGAVVDAENHRFDDVRRHARRRLYRLELIGREPPDPNWSGSEGKVQRARQHQATGPYDQRSLRARSRSLPLAPVPPEAAAYGPSPQC